MPRRPHEKLPSNINDLEGVTKAAILLVAVGEEPASELLRTMQPEQVEELMRELAGLGRVPEELQSQVIEEFYTLSLRAKQIGEQLNKQATGGNLYLAAKSGVCDIVSSSRNLWVSN